MKIGVAILGLGRWGINLARNFCYHPLAEVVALVDPCSERLAYCQNCLGLSDRPVKLATSWHSICNLVDIDAVVVATPASTHYALIYDALDRGYHVLAEKPLTLNPKECLQLSLLAQQKQLQLLVDHTYLFHPATEKGREIIQAGDLGSLRYGYATRTHLGPVRQDVDALWDLAIHDLAIFNHWLQQTPIEVRATGTTWLQSDRKMPGCHENSAQGLSDLVWVNLTYPNGFQAYIHLCWLNGDKQRRLCLVGDRASLIFDEMSPSPLTLQRGYLQPEGEGFVPTGLYSESIAVASVEPLAQVCDRFLQDISNQTFSSLSSATIGTQLVQILDCLTLSLHEQGQAIAVPLL